MFRDISIRYKIILMILVIFVFISGISLTIFSISESKNQQAAIEKQAVFLAKFTADNSSTPLFFGNKKKTTEILNNLSSIKGVFYACIYDINGDLFDAYNPNKLNISKVIEKKASLSQETTINLSDSTIFKFKTLIVTHPIQYAGVTYGKVCLAYSLEEVNITIRKSMRTAGGIVLVILIIVYLLAFLFQRIISDPILSLANFTDKIKKTGNYQLRIKKHNNDEIGILYDSFNNMLEQIHHRNMNRDLNEKELNEARVQAETADKLKSAFLANMSHEIRTPMNSIIGFAGLLNDEELNEKDRQEFIDLINSSSATLLHLIDDILDISKIEAGQLKVSIENCNLSTLINELFLTFNETNQNSNHGQVELLLNIPTQFPNICIDTDTFRLKQIISNLLSNSIKFTHSGQIEFGYTIIEKIKNNSRKKFIKFFVNDTGIGMSPEISKVIFERFTKIESDNDKLYRGAGLGLTITKKLVELLNGEIWVQSEVDKGSSFTFILPAPEDLHIHSTDIQTNSTNEPQANLNKLEGKSILVVEDDISNFELLKAILKKSSANLTWAKNGIEAIGMCEKSLPDIILMDIKMPDMDGYETVSRLRDMNISVPIIAQTAFARIDDEQNILKSGFDAYISKPIERKKLLSILLELLRN